jgi:hypothetical protein
VGLAEKRVLNQFALTVFPGLKQQVDEAAGFDVPLEVRWDTLAKDATHSSSWLTGWPKIYFQPMIDAFQQICVDDLGKQALRTGLKRVVIQDTRVGHSSWWATFEGGTLTLDTMFTNVDAVADRTKVLRDAIENGL